MTTPKAETPDDRPSLAEQMAQDQAEQDEAERAAEAVSADYTGKPCQHCGRIRVYLRRDGRLICEKCEQFNEPEPSDVR